MKMIFCMPEITMKDLESAKVFFSECKEILDTYVANKIYISSIFQINQLLMTEADENDILIFFNAAFCHIKYPVFIGNRTAAKFLNY